MRKRIEAEFTPEEYKVLKKRARRMKTSMSQALKAMALFFGAGCTHTQHSETIKSVLK